MLFDGIARFISKHHRLIIVLWLVALGGCLPFLTKTGSVTSSQQGLGGASGDSATAQRIINSSFPSSGSGQALFLVINTGNVTTPNVRAFINAFNRSATSDRALSNYTGVGSAYTAVTRVVAGAVSAVEPLESGTTAFAELEYAIPDTYVRIWTSFYGASPQEIPAANTTASNFIAGSISNKTEAAMLQRYMYGFVDALAYSYQTAPSLTENQHIQSAVDLVAPRLVQQTIPKSEQGFALKVLQSFSISNYSDPAAIENFVTAQVPAFTLYTTQLARSVYPLTLSTPAGNESALVQAVVVNYTEYGVPKFYQSAITGYVSPNHHVMIVTASFGTITQGDVTEVRSLVSSIAQTYGLKGDVTVTGDEAITTDFVQSSFQDLKLILPITIIILIAATGIFFRSVVTPGISLASIGIALGIADSAIIYFIGAYVVGIDSNVPNILLTVLIGVGTDYSVFLLARYREERVRGVEKVQAVQNSVTWAGESIATSGLTVIISFIFLGSLQSVALLRSLGLVVGAGVLVALAASLTLIPSIVLVMPNRVFWPNVGARFAGYAQGVERSITNKTSYFSRSAKFSIKHAKLVVVVALFATAPAVYVWIHAPVGYDFLAAAPSNAESVVGFNTISANFGAGTLYPTYVVMQFKSPVWNGTAYNASEMRVIDAVSNDTLAMSNVQSVAGPTRPSGDRVDFLNLGNDSRSRLLEGSINKMLSANGTFALLNINLVDSPQSATSLTTAQGLRTLYASLVQQNPDTLKAVYLGGSAGSTLDSKNSINGQFDQVILYVMVGVAIVLLIVLGSLFLPLFAIASIAMSIAWTLSATDLVFEHFYNFPLLFITPLTLFVLLLGLGMDYNIFILTRIREEATKGAPLNDAITTAIERTGGIITAAAIILAGSLGALMLSNNLLLKEFGFAFFYSILIDAMVMRTYIVPSVMSLMGKWNWYAPGRLQRVKTPSVKEGN
ncbi:MAG TPA: MMPL family transporter [Nitrososphaerales archaeon]|nr:MMPL family transporter [Nitrososphaerales archaeon]